MKIFAKANCHLLLVCLVLCLLLLQCISTAKAQGDTWQTFANNTNCSLQLIFKQFDYEHDNRVIQQLQVPLEVLNTGYPIDFAGGTWQVNINFSPVQGRPQSADLDVVVTLLNGKTESVNISVAFVFHDWSKEHFVLMPSGVYQGNRFTSRAIRYSPKLMDPRDIGPDKPPVINDIPRLNIGAGPSQLQDRSGSLAMPAMGFFNKQSQQVIWLSGQQANQWGDYGLNIMENRDRSKATFSFSSPLVRELKIYHITNFDVPSPDRGADLQAGDQIPFRLRANHFPASRLQDLYTTYATIRGDLLPKPAYRPILPYSAAFQVQATKFNRDNWVPEFGYYAIGMRENFLQDWQIGWTGGMISTYPLLLAGDSLTRKRVLQHFHWLIPNGLAPSGFFYDSGQGGNQWYGGDIRYPHTRNWHLVRKGADGLYFVLKQLMLLEQQGETVPEAWKKPMLGVAEAFVKVWDRYGQMGQFVHTETGEIMVGGSASGAILPAALILCADYYNRQDLLEKAMEMGEYFYQNFTLKGITTGGPGDAMQNPDSESSFALVETYAALYDATKQEKWKTYAREAAEQFATWVLAYNYQFPEQSCFGKLNMHSTGAVFANVQNRHAAPHICTHSGLALLKIYRATGNTYFLELLREIVFHATQYLSTPERPVCNMKPGWMNERVQTTDWETLPLGEVFPGSTWAETATMLSYVEVPGLYIDAKAGKYTIFDNLEVTAERVQGRNVMLHIHNPTQYDAKLRIWVDHDTQKPLPVNYLYGGESLVIPAGSTKVYRFKK
jgi:hypothetical protein